MSRLQINRIIILNKIDKSCTFYYNYTTMLKIKPNQITPFTVRQLYNSVYIPDRTVIFVTYLGGPNTTMTKNRIKELNEQEILQISIVDMRRYENPNQWFIAGYIINNDNKTINNTVLEFQYPRDKFTINKISSLQQLATNMINDKS